MYNGNITRKHICIYRSYHDGISHGLHNTGYNADITWVQPAECRTNCYGRSWQYNES